MTKYEWESGLKKGIASLPLAEKQRVLEYYDEIFSDKAEQGMKEEEIVAEFGNPYEAAAKILADYYGDSAKTEVEPSKAEEPHKDEEAKVAPKKKGFAAAYPALVAILCTIGFFVWGGVWGKWHPAWILFLAVPILITLVDAIYKRDARVFCYPVVCVVVFLALGFCCQLWHPAWVVFITVPLYYILVDAFSGKGKAK